MGIKGFTKFYQNCEERIPIDEFIKQNRDKYVLVDALNILYTYRIKNNNKNYNSVKNICRLILSFQLKPIFIFDGHSAHNKRRRTIQSNKDSNKDSNKNGKDNKNDVNKIDINNYKNILSEMKIPFINDLCEADPQCAALSMYYDNICGVISNDTDMLIYGCNTMFPHFTYNYIHLYKSICVIRRERIFKFISDEINKYKSVVINNDIFIKWNILMGTDYCYGIVNKDKNLQLILKSFVDNDFDINKTINENKFMVNHNLIHKFDSILDIYTNTLIRDPEYYNYILSA